MFEFGFEFKFFCFIVVLILFDIKKGFEKYKEGIFIIMLEMYLLYLKYYLLVCSYLIKFFIFR